MMVVPLLLALLGPADASAVYALRAEKPRYRGQVERFEVFVSSSDRTVPRLGVRFHHSQGSFAFVAEGPGAHDLLRRRRRLELTRYVYVAGSGQAIEFRNRARDEPFLPFSFSLQADAFLPVCLDERGRFLPQALLLWDTLTLDASPSTGKPPEADGAKQVVLSDDLLIGTSRNFRDTDGRRIPQAEFDHSPSLDYTYRPHNAEDLAKMLEAGFNYFDRVLPDQLAYLLDKPALFDLAGLQGKQRPLFPEIFYHPGFQGVEDFLDEPAYIFSEDFEPDDTVTLEAMARLQEQRTRDQYDRVARGRQPGLDEHLRWAGVTLEGRLVEPPFPIWEEFYSTGCYQLHVPVSGFIHEGRYRHPQTVDLLNRTFHTNLPRDPETMFRFHFAFLRGAARVFEKDWGMSIYGQADREVSLLGMNMAYDRGARWVYFWSSDRGHHLPFEEQLTLARGLSEHVTSHPREPRRKLVCGADDAIVLPYGFTFNVSDWQKARLPGLWQRGAYPVEMGAMADGTPYSSVLRVATEEMERLCAEGREFDIVVDMPQLRSAGYARLHEVLPRARKDRYDFLRLIRAEYYYLLAGLVAFLVIFRGWRIVRWLRRRRAIGTGE